MSVNKVILIGNLGRDPELRYLQSGSPVATLSIATTRKWRDKRSNQMQEETEWHRVSVFGSMAENCNNYLAKGRQVYVEGRLRTRSYEDRDGVKKYATEIIADQVKFLGSNGGGSERGAPRGGAGSQPRSGSHPSDDGYDPGEYVPGNEQDYDLPF